MPETPGVQETPATQNENPDAENPQGGTSGVENPDAGGSSGDPAEGSQSADSPLWDGIPDDHPVRSEVQKLRDEAASKRTEARAQREAKEALEAQLQNATSKEDFDKAIADYEVKLQQATIETTRERVGRTHGLPDELVARLQGATEAELEADATALKAVLGNRTPAPTPKNPPSGGLSPRQETSDPAAIAARIASARNGSFIRS